MPVARYGILAIAIAAMLGSVAPAEETTPESWRIIRGAGPNLPTIGRLQTRHARDIESTPWSVGCETLDRDCTVYDNYKAYVGLYGHYLDEMQQLRRCWTWT